MSGFWEEYGIYVFAGQVLEHEMLARKDLQNVLLTNQLPVEFLQPLIMKKSVLRHRINLPVFTRHIQELVVNDAVASILSNEETKNDYDRENIAKILQNYTRAFESSRPQLAPSGYRQSADAACLRYSQYEVRYMGTSAKTVRWGYWKSIHEKMKLRIEGAVNTDNGPEQWQQIVNPNIGVTNLFVITRKALVPGANVKSYVRRVVLNYLVPDISRTIRALEWGGDAKEIKAKREDWIKQIRKKGRFRPFDPF